MTYKRIQEKGDKSAKKLSQGKTNCVWTKGRVKKGGGGQTNGSLVWDKIKRIGNPKKRGGEGETARKGVRNCTGKTTQTQLKKTGPKRQNEWKGGIFGKSVLGV